jgi:hypothetical protein
MSVKIKLFLQPLDRVAIALMAILSLITVLLLFQGDAIAPRVRDFSWQNKRVGATDSAFYLNFSRPMNTQSVEDNLQIDPQLPGKISWAGRKMAYTLLAPPPYGNTYQVQLNGAKDRFADVKVQTVETGAFFYPDVLISCDPRDKTASKFVCFPCLIAEILSPSTEAYDRVAKFAQYRRLESLREYVLISSEKISVDIFRLNDSQKWELTPYAAGEIVQFTSIDFECPIELLYEDVELLPPENGYGRIG